MEQTRLGFKDDLLRVCIRLRVRWRIQNPVKHLRWSAFEK